MSKHLRAAAWGTALLIAAGLAAVLILGPQRLWAQFGPADLGEIDFATLARRATPNDALACLPIFCAATADVAAPVFQRPSGDVYLAIQNAVAHEPGLEQVAADAGQGTLRFVQRSNLMGFPDTINVKVAATSTGGSTVLIYSRSQLGVSDMGVNRARVERWIRLISAKF
jgi:uncharacterized protein (DUF1499 family)